MAASGGGVLAPKQGRLQHPKSNPGGLEYSRPGGLEAWIFEAWRLGSLDWIGVLGGLDWIGVLGGLVIREGRCCNGALTRSTLREVGGFVCVFSIVFVFLICPRLLLT